ncbi:E3 ubiquitin-protein ligase RHF1A-like [Citrus sinensis]|uniref:E3 ubiquitin-protein ligase RHF1A-like n=1 Tax=Citrus sinensis TaxID=2711 RepID=UPI002278EEA5|nr:E3 ubiquitin-protein ligase RHF1A-like [Citrus sinensis]
MSQEVLTTIASERLSKSRHIAPAALVTFPEDFDNGLEARVMQHLATVRYFRKRDMQRYPGLDVPQVVDSSSVANASLTLPTKFSSDNHHLIVQEGQTLRRYSPSQSLKSKWSAASARYKKLISKGTCSLKERLVSRNTSVKQLGKEVQHEMSAGITGVAKMIERLNLASK